jgi:hypothetical protein
MSQRKNIVPLTTAATGVAILVLVLANVPPSKADNPGNDTQSQIQIGFAIAPVALNMNGRNPALVGLGSYIVNAVADCNGCHSANPQYLPGGDPAQGQPTMVNKAGYLAGGNPLFGPFFIPRNLTPDKTGKPEGGTSFDEFQRIMRTGVDPDRAHPQFGPFLQVMPWPVFRHMTDNDIQAIYEYLSAIPCVEGDPGLPNPRPLGTRCN